MYIPYRTRSVAVNTTVKNVIYQDTVLSLKDVGANLCVTKLSVKAHLLEECLNMIFESNPDVTFNTVQYSPKNKEVIFYTDKKISTDKWCKRYDSTYRYSDSTSIIEQIREVLETTDSLDVDSISAYDVWMIYRTLEIERERFEEQIKESINKNLKRESNSYYCCIHGYDFDEDEQRISIHTGEYSNVCFKEKNGDFFVDRIEKKHFSFPENILSIIGHEVSELFEYYQSRREEFTQKVDKVRSVNSNFYLRVGSNWAIISDKSDWLENSFEFYASRYAKCFKCKSNSGNVHEMLRNHENEFAKKVFVKISDCPKWMQEELAMIRQKQIEDIRLEMANMETLAMDEVKKLAKKQAIRNILKNIIPFMK